MLTITIQLDEQGRCALPEHRDLLQRALKQFAEKEVDVKIEEITVFTDLVNAAIDCQNEFTKAVNGGERRWTNEDFTILRSKMSVSYYSLSDAYAQSKVNEKSADLSRQMLLDREKIRFSEEGSTPSVSTTKAKASEVYENANKEYLEAYKMRVMLEELMSSLDKSMNAISGIQKHDINKLKF